MNGVLAGKRVLSLTVGDNFTCALASDDKAYCWGGNDYGQLGNNSTASSNVPVAVNTTGVLAGKTVRSIAGGSFHTCATASDGRAYCWGWNAYGQLGNNSITDSSVPIAVDVSGVLAGKTIRSLSGGAWFSCAVTADDLAYCWGDNWAGQLGNNTYTASRVPVAVVTTGAMASKGVRTLYTGNSHGCVIATDSKAYCWGLNDRGQLGDNSTTWSPVPIAVNTAGVLAGKTIRSFEIGVARSCVIASDDNAYCWGLNTTGQLDNNSTTQSLVPVAVNTAGVLAGKRIDHVSVDNEHSCAVTIDNQSACWGTNTNGQLGNNATSQSLVPVAVNGMVTQDSIVTAALAKLQLQYAPKAPAGTCSAVATDWAPVTSTSAISYDNTAPNDGTVISSFANDPTAPNTYGYVHQSIVRGTTTSAHTFQNTAAFAPGQTGLWDVVLRDRSNTNATNYCFRLVTDTTQLPNSSVDRYTAYPELTTALGQLSIRFVDGSGTTINNPTIPFSAATVQSTAQATTAQLTNTTSRYLEVRNTIAGAGFNVTVAADPTTPNWSNTGGTRQYPYNHATVASGSLNVNAGTTRQALGQLPDGSTCSTSTGLINGENTRFIAGTKNSITLLSGSSASGTGCGWNLQNIALTQTIPTYQLGDTYNMKLIATVVTQ